MPRSEGRPAPPGPPGGTKLAAALLVLLPACRLFGPESPKGRNEDVNRSLLERLLTGDVVTPVQDFDQESYFDELERLYAEPEPPEPVAEDVDAEGVWKLGPEPINPYVEFGTRIWIDEPTGFVVKPYPFPSGMGENVLRMLQIYGDFEIDSVTVDGLGLPPIAEQRPEAAVLDLRKAVDREAFTAVRAPTPAPSQSMQLADWLIVRAQPEVMLEVEHFIELFAGRARQIEIEAKIVEVTTSDSYDQGIRPIDDSTPIFGLPNPGSLINSIDYSFGNSVGASEAIFGTTAVFDGVEFNALLELIASNESVSIISRPKVAVREGAQADIVNTRDVPYFEIQSINSNGTFKTDIKYTQVGVQMYIIPRVVGTDTIVLNIDIEVSQETGTAVVLPISSGGDQDAVISVPEISQRATRTIVRLEPGQAVILGGLISERRAERERKIPFLGDVPLLGNLFKSRFLENRQTNVLFFIRPRILQGAEFAGEDF